MDRVAQLAEEAEIYLRFERERCAGWTGARDATRRYLTVAAREFGFPESEISSAIDTALGGR